MEQNDLGYFKTKYFSTRSDVKIENKGDENATYFMGVSPNYKNSPNADNYAIVIIKELPDGKFGVVNNYANPTTEGRLDYFKWALESFNIEGIYTSGVPIAGQEFVRIGFPEYEDKVHVVKFDNKNIRAMNELLQFNLEHRNLFFGELDRDGLEPMTDYRGLAKQKNLMENLKIEISNINVTTTAQGTQSFDLPSEMRKQNGKDKPRKDSYYALVSAIFGHCIDKPLLEIGKKSKKYTAKMGFIVTQNINDELDDPVIFSFSADSAEGLFFEGSKHMASAISSMKTRGEPFGKSFEEELGNLVESVGKTVECKGGV